MASVRRQHPRSAFSPTSPIVDRRRLVGRDEDLRQIARWISQARNVVLTGDRGVGKTSLVSVLYGILRAAEFDELWQSEKQPLAARCTCTGGQGIDAIVDMLISSLSRNADFHPEQVERTSRSVTAGLPLVKGEIRKDTQRLASELPLPKLVDFVARLRRQRKNYAASLIVFFVDEADQINESERLGSFVRSATETLASDGLGETSFVIIGQPTLVKRFESEHPSVLRASELFQVRRLTENDCREIIAVGERDSGVKFDDGIRNYIATSARGFPAVVQRLGDSCCEVDTDAIVDANDFEEALRQCQSRLMTELPLHEIYQAAGSLGQEILWILASNGEYLPEESLLEKLRHPADTTRAAVHMLESALLLERKANSLRVRDRLLSAYISLSEIRGRDLRAIEELALKWTSNGWTVAERQQGAYRGIDIVARRDTAFARRTIGIAYVGPAKTLETKPISLIASQFAPALSLYQLDELVLVGEDMLSPEKADAIESIGHLRYVPWNLVDRITGILSG